MFNEDRRRRPAPTNPPAEGHLWVEVPRAPGGWVSYRGPEARALETARRVWGRNEVTGEVR